MSDQSPPCSSAAYLSIALSLDYAQNPLRRNTLTRFGANRRRKLALWPPLKIPVVSRSTGMETALARESLCGREPPDALPVVW